MPSGSDEKLTLTFHSENSPAPTLPQSAVNMTRQFPQLQELRLWIQNVELPATTNTMLAIHPKIISLTVNNSPSLTDDSLGGSTNLQELSITNAPMFRGTRLAEFTRLERLTLIDTAVDDATLAAIVRLKTLRHLTIRNKHYETTPQGWAMLQSAPYLETININPEVLDLESQTELRKIPASSDWDWQFEDLSPATWQALNRLSPIRFAIKGIGGGNTEGQGSNFKLSFWYSGASKSSILRETWEDDDRFRQHVNKLQLSDWLADDTVLLGSDALTTLSILQMPNFEGHRLGIFPCLEHLALVNTGLDDEGFEQILTLKQLKSLRIERGDGVSPENWSRLTELQELETVYVANSRNVHPVSFDIQRKSEENHGKV